MIATTNSDSVARAVKHIYLWDFGEQAASWHTAPQREFHDPLLVQDSVAYQSDPKTCAARVCMPQPALHNVEPLAVLGE